MEKVLSCFKIKSGALSSTFFKVDFVLTQEEALINKTIKRAIFFMVMVAKVKRSVLLFSDLVLKYQLQSDIVPEDKSA